MTTSGTILVGIDGSDQDWTALDWAAAEATALRSDLMLVHVGGCRPAPGWEPLELQVQDRQWTREVIETAVSRVHVGAAGVAVQAWRLDGDPTTDLLRLAAEADRVVLGILRGCGAGGALHGSVPAQVAARAGRSVVVVRGRRGRPGPVVAGIEGTGRDDPVLQQAFAYARRHRLPLRALHMYGAGVADPNGLAGGYLHRDDAAAAVEAAVARWAPRYPEVLAESVALPGTAAHRLIEVSAGAGLGVVGAGTRAGLAAGVRRSVGHALLRRSRCPVLLAR